MFRPLIAPGLVMVSVASPVGVEAGGSGLVCEGRDRQATRSISNPDDRPCLIPVRGDKNPAAGDGDNTFVATPPLFRLEPHSQNSVRIVYTGKPLPTDRESLFWLSIKTVPGIPKEEANRLLISVKSVFKLFYRPTGLNGDPATAYEKITFTRRGGQVFVSNPTPYHISFYELTVGNVRVKTPPTLKPMSEQALAVPAGDAGTVSWRTLNDFGGITDVKKAKI
jgi:P pilus assembly protein, chaperone PapD